MSLVKFELSKDFTTLKIIGSDFNLKVLKDLNTIINKINKKDYIEEVKIIGNFNTKLLIEDTFTKKNDLDEILYLSQSITKTIERSNIKFTSFINGITKGPAMEIALSCNFIKAEKESVIDFDIINKGYIPILGTIQRLTRILGYKKALHSLLIDKFIGFADASKLEVINNQQDNINKIIKKKFFWDNSFTNTFIFFNSKIHSKYKNKKPCYNAILSIIFEGSICQYEEGLSIEKRWLKWLILNKHSSLEF